MASRALIARLRIASSSWLASMLAGGNPRGISSRSATRGPSDRSSRSIMPWISARRSTGTARRSCCRANASRRCVSDAPRSAPCIAPSISRCSRGSSGRRLRNRSRLPITAISRLLKSCATPPVSWPIVSIFCAWRNCSCAFSRAATSFIRSAVRCSTRCSSVAVNSASAVRSAANCASRILAFDFGGFARGDVGGNAHQRSDAAVGPAHRARADIDPMHRAVGPDVAVFEAIVLAGLDRAVERLAAAGRGRRDGPLPADPGRKTARPAVRPKNVLQVSEASSSNSGRCNSSAPRWPAFNAVCSRPSLSVRSSRMARV